MRCPICNGIQTGKVGVDQYYCWNCFVEFCLNHDLVEVYEVSEDGSLVNVSPMDIHSTRG